MFAGEENARQVGVQNALPEFQRHLMDESADIDARVGEDAVRRAELLLNEREGLRYLGFVRDVASQADRSACTLASRRIGSPFCALTVLIQNGNAVTTLGAQQRGGTTNTAATTGDNDEPIF